MKYNEFNKLRYIFSDQRKNQKKIHSTGEKNQVLHLLSF